MAVEDVEMEKINSRCLNPPDFGSQVAMVGIEERGTDPWRKC